MSSFFAICDNRSYNHRMFHKTTSTVLALSLLCACNFCLVECAFASEEHHHLAQFKGNANHPHESDNEDRSGSDKHDAGSLCCSSLVAVKNSSSNSTDINFLKGSFSHAIVLERFIPRQLNTLSEYEIEFPPGASPPAVFLLTHFTHAPPVSL